jgi:thiol-disulfide isomerase/thioredoxin
MGKADRIRQNNARAKIAAQQAAARRAESRRRMLFAGTSVLAVIAIVVVLVVVHAIGGKSSDSSASAASATSSGSTAATVAKDLADVPTSTLNSVGAGSNIAKLIPTSGQPMLTAGGKPEILYVGAEYCPYCAAERWAMDVALSRFGTFSGVNLTHSSSSDVYANTPTLTFYHSTYTSKYVDFTPVEWYSRTTESNGSYKVLQAPTASQSKIFGKYDAPPYISSSDTGSFPFVDFGNQYLVIGAQYLPSTLSGLSWTQVATDVSNPSSPVAKDIDGAANSLTAAICKITKNADTAVCTSSAAQAGAGSL